MRMRFLRSIFLCFSLLTALHGFSQSATFTTIPAAVNGTINVCAGQLFGSSLLNAPEGTFALVACVVVLGFKWEEFDMPSKEALLKTYEGNAAALEVVQALSR